jgi:outer membrane receptor protein involved in Fe transport
MRFRVLVLFAVSLPLLAATALQAQTTTSELSGRVTFEDRGMPGVAVTVRSSALQGERTTVTNAQGDYVIKFLPAGTYAVRFELEEYADLEYELKITTSQPKFLDAVMYPEAMQGEIVVAGQYEAVSTGARGSSTTEQSTLEQLPVARDLNSAVLLSAGTFGLENGFVASISGARANQSLFTMNGVVLNENDSGQPIYLYIEDAILETTTMTNSISAEYGRFSGGVVNMVTKSGGNEFSGSFRVNVSNDSWNGATPLTTDRVDENNYFYEATFGGYILRDALWFFLAGRDQEDTTSGQLFHPSGVGEVVPVTRAQNRLEGKLTAAFGANHRLTVGYIDIDTEDTNLMFWGPADWASVDLWRATPINAWNLSYTGVLTDNFFVEGMYSEREFRFVGSGGDDTSIGGGTPVYDYLYGATFNAPWFCGVCRPEERSNRNLWGKASWFVSGAGTHDLVFGADIFSDMIQSDVWQTASGYALGTWTPQDYSTPGSPLLIFQPYDYIVWDEVLETSKGSDFRTNSLYVNDTWRVSDRVTLNLGVRYDANEGTDQGGAKTVDDSLVSPRLSATWDIRGDGSIILTGGASRYVKEIGQTGDLGAAAGNPVRLTYLYAGPTIIAGTPEYPTNHDAIEAIFDWFFNVYGGVSNTDLLYYAFVPGLTPKVSDHLSSPYADEITLGASFRLGTRGVLRLDYLNRRFGNFYVGEIVPNRWATEPDLGIVVDQALWINENELAKKTYDALLARFDYRIGSRWSFGANLTLSEVSSNSPWGLRAYQEYKDPSWNSPTTTDRRHTLRGWIIWNAIATNRHNLSLSLLQNFQSGNHYGAWGDINTVPYVGEPSDLGYAESPGAVAYAFELDAYRTDDITRTDLALNYSFFVNILGGQLEIFLQPEVTNVFNESGVTWENKTVFTARQWWSGLEPFNPWTTEPVEGVHWAKGPQFGEPTDELSFQQPRTFRFSVGVRF